MRRNRKAKSIKKGSMRKKYKKSVAQVKRKQENGKAGSTETREKGCAKRKCGEEVGKKEVK